MNPPPIGEALGVGWNTLKANMVPILIGTLCAMVAGIIPFLGLPGLFLVSLKALRGEIPEPKDGFAGFTALVDHLVMGLIQFVGVIACCVGMYVTMGIFFPGSFLILDKGMGWSDAKDKCLEAIKPNWLPWTLFFLATALVGGSGAILCGIGAIVTMPIGTIAMAYAYEQTLGGKGRRA